MRRRSLVTVFLLLSSVLAPSIGRAASGSPAAPWWAPYREGRIVVKYRDHVAEEDKSLCHHRHGSRALRRFPEFRMEAVEVRSGISVRDAVDEYQADPDVEYAEPDYLLHTRVVPNDLTNYDLWALGKIGAQSAWNVTTGSREVVVAVIDSGIDYTHPDLVENLWVNAAERDGRPDFDDDGNGVKDDIHGYNAAADPNTGDPRDDGEHGTHVAGIIGAVGSNGQGVAGINWNVRIMACKFIAADGSGTTSDAVACLQYVKGMKDRGVNVVATNNSWGGGGYSKALHDAIAAQQDILFITAAGNDAQDNDAIADYPSGYGLPNMITVAASDPSDRLTSFSNYGYSVHLSAPGKTIVSTVPGGAYEAKSGTSMAAPFVTGLAALLKAANPSLDWKGIKNLILAGADPVPELKAGTMFGGRLNAAASLACGDRSVLSPVTVPSASNRAGVPVTVSALSIRCAAPQGTVTAGLSTGEVIELKDDGAGPDLAAGDGLFSATWTPKADGPAAMLRLFSPISPKEGVPGYWPLSIRTASLPQPTQGMAYEYALESGGGVPPYEWSANGTLPAGLVLDRDGTLHGTPTASGAFSFLVQGADADGNTASRSFTVTVKAG